MSSLDYGYLVLKNGKYCSNEELNSKIVDKVILEELDGLHWAGIDLGNNVLVLYKMWLRVFDKETGLEEGITLLDTQHPFKTRIIEIDGMKYKVKGVKKNQTFLVSFNVGEDSYKVFMGYGLSEDWYKDGSPESYGYSRKTIKLLNKLCNKKYKKKKKLYR